MNPRYLVFEMLFCADSSENTIPEESSKHLVYEFARGSPVIYCESGGLVYFEEKTWVGNLDIFDGNAYLIQRHPVISSNTLL